jgi:Asparagine synthase
MRWLVGWSSAPRRFGAARRTVLPVGAQQLWTGPDPLWAVGDWRPDEIRVIEAEPVRTVREGARNGSPTAPARLAVLGRCRATDAELRLGLYTARGGAVRHLTTWPGSYTAVLQLGRRTVVLGDLAGARPVFHTPWQGGTAYATAALPLADLVEAGLDVSHLAALLACPESPEALGDRTPYLGVRRMAPGCALVLREGAPQITPYEPPGSLAGGATPLSGEEAVEAIRDALVDAVRARMPASPGHPDPVTGRPPTVGADLSGGSASATLALLAAGLPGVPGLPGTLTGASGERLLAVTFNDMSTGAVQGREAELERARRMAADPRLRHVVVPGGAEALPYADLETLPLTDEPGPALVTAERNRRRLAAGGLDHLVGHGARQVLDAHPARLADLLLDRRRRTLIRPATALARTEAPSARAVFVPFSVYRAARRLARTPYQRGVEDAAARLLERRFETDAERGPALEASLDALNWCRPGPAARWLTGEALAEVSVRLSDAARRPGPVERPGQRRARAALNRHAADHRVFEQAAEVRGQRVHAPFLDNQVVRACAGLPEALRVRPGARAAVLRAVLASSGVRELPEGWGANTHTSTVTAVRAGLRTAVDDLIDIFHAPLLADTGLVEAHVVRGALAEAANGAPLPLDGLAELVSTEVWLRRLLARRGTCWTGEDAPHQRAVAGVPRPTI